MRRPTPLELLTQNEDKVRRKCKLYGSQTNTKCDHFLSFCDVFFAFYLQSQEKTSSPSSLPFASSDGKLLFLSTLQEVKSSFQIFDDPALIESAFTSLRTHNIHINTPITTNEAITHI